MPITTATLKTADRSASLSPCEQDSCQGPRRFANLQNFACTVLVRVHGAGAVVLVVLYISLQSKAYNHLIFITKQLYNTPMHSERAPIKAQSIHPVQEVL